MLAHVPREMSDEEIRREAVLMQSNFTGGFLWVTLPKDGRPGEHSLVRTDKADWYNLDPKPPEGGTTLRVHTLRRYYGIGYERGPLVEILAVARWLRTRLGAEIYYGGDNCDFVTTLASQEEALWEHFCSEDGREYYGSWDRGKKPHICSFCDRQATTNMWSGDTRGCYCMSCGQHWLIDGSGVVTETDQNYGRDR